MCRKFIITGMRRMKSKQILKNTKKAAALKRGSLSLKSAIKILITYASKYYLKHSHCSYFSQR